MPTKENGTPSVKESSTVTDSAKTDTTTKTPEELAKIAEDQKGRAVKAETDLKSANSTIDDLKAQLEAKADDKGDVSNADIKALAEKHGVDPAFAEDLANTLQSTLSKEVKTTEEKLAKEIEAGKTERNQEKLDKAFDAAFDASTDGYEDLEVDKDSVKELYFARKSKNADLTVADVLQSLYGAASGKATTEDDAGGGDRGDGGETIDFASASKDGAQLEKIMKDPKAKAAYYKWRDANDM